MSNHRKIDYIEFSVSDITRTKEFYGAVFGWKFTDYGPDYTSFEDGRLSGGFAKAPTSGQIGAVLVIMYSENLTETKASVEKSGGSISRDIFEFPGGKRFHFMDPNGNELAVWSDK